jgi:hypothetical protein
VLDAMFAEAMHEPVLCTDATGVLVLAKQRCRTGRFWVLVAPDQHVLYRYSKRHDSLPSTTFCLATPATALPMRTPFTTI